MSSRAWLTLFATLLCGAPAHAQRRYDVYFVAVGSDNYAQPAAAYHFSPLQNAADRSGLRVAELFEHAGARFGVALVSDETHYVTRADIENALKSVRAEIVRERAARPLLIFYFAGHGVSEGIGWNHFSIPGDFASRKEIPALSVAELTANTVHSAALVDTLESFKIPFVLLLDTCSEGKREDFRYSVLSGTAQQNLRDVSGALRYINEFHDSYPTLFSAEPGKVAITVPDPRDPDFSSLGPIARRLTIIFDRVNQSHTPLSLQSVLYALTSATLDANTKPAISHTEMKDLSDLIAGTALSTGRIKRVTGTATKAAICCGASAPVPSATSAQDVTGTIRFDGKVGEFITDGRPYKFVSPPATFTLTTLEAGRISIEIDNVPGAPWSISCDTGNRSRFAPRTYAAAQRFDFSDKGHPGLELSGNGHACNAVAGSYSVDAVDYAPDGKLNHLTLQFKQLCDDVGTPLTGGMDIQVPR